jgi:ABC-type transport system involved in multi-copper enzyme maturation permease subunit
VPIYDQSYAHWEGHMEGRILRWLPITLNGIRLAFRSKVFLVVFCLALIPFVVRIGMVFIFNMLPDELDDNRMRNWASVDATFYHNYLSRDQLISVILMCLFVGCGLIARDLKVRALEIYFSKPIKLLDYLAGKFATMAFFMLCMSLFPSLLIFLADYLLSEEGTFLSKASHLPGVFLVSFVLTVTMSMLVLAASSLCRTTRNAALLWFGFVVSLMIAGMILKPVFSLASLELIDLRMSIRYLSRVFLDVQPVMSPESIIRPETDYSVHWIFPLIYIAALNILCAIVLLRRVRGVEADHS